MKEGPNHECQPVCQWIGYLHQNGYFARTFAKETHAGMVGIDVGIPVPVGIFGFTGHKLSFFGDLHVMGRDGFIFYTESKNVTSTWFAEDATDHGKVDTWDGTMTSMPEKDESIVTKECCWKDKIATGWAKSNPQRMGNGIGRLSQGKRFNAHVMKGRKPTEDRKRY